MSRKTQTQCFYMDAETFDAIAFLKTKDLRVSKAVREAIKSEAEKNGWQRPVAESLQPEGDEG